LKKIPPIPVTLAIKKPPVFTASYFPDTYFLEIAASIFCASIAISRSIPVGET
jgi:hypothetical protein